MVVSHPDYVSWTNECLHPGLAGPGQGSRAITLTGDVTLVLGKPFTVHGRVSDENGKAIPRANIGFHRGSIPYFQTNCISGDDGSFMIGSVPPDYTHVQLTAENRSQRMPIELLATAPGFGAVTLSHPGDKDAIEPLEVVLKPGVLIHGQVVDQYGVPAQDVHIRGTGFGVSTDPSGRFTWKDAPADNLHVTLWKPGPTVKFEQYSLERPASTHRNRSYRFRNGALAHLWNDSIRLRRPIPVICVSTGDLRGIAQGQPHGTSHPV